MTESHDQNFKNLLMDFPEEALMWIFPDAVQHWGAIRKIDFIRQEPKKRSLFDSHFVLDIPILFSFEQNQLLLWLVEFQEDKSKFSIYKLLRYVSDYMEAYPDATVIPTVLFTKRKRWKKDVKRELKTEFNGRRFLQFEYILLKLFDFNARNYYHYSNPLVKILLPKMNYEPHERTEVILQAYKGLFDLVTPMLFDKYVDFIDIYAEIHEHEKEMIYEEIQEKKETAMLAKYIRSLGLQEGIQTGIPKGQAILIHRQIIKKYHLAPEKLTLPLEKLTDDDLLELGEKILDWDSFDNVETWFHKRGIA